MATDNEIAFPYLTEDEIDGLRRFGKERAMAAGEILFAEGDRGFCFFVVLEGSIEIVTHSSDEERRIVEQQIVVHGVRQFTGDVDMLSGRAASSRGAPSKRGASCNSAPSRSGRPSRICRTSVSDPKVSHPAGDAAGHRLHRHHDRRIATH